MYIPDIWAMVTGLASIISLLISVSNKFPNWKKYMHPVGFVFAGFALGRISLVLSPAANQVFQDPYLAGILIILLLLLIAGVISFIFMLKHGQPGLAYFIFLIIITMAAPQLMKIYSDANPAIPPGDYLKLATIKEENGDIEEAIKYLKKFIERTSDKSLKEKVNEKISILRQKQIIKELNLPKKGFNKTE